MNRRGESLVLALAGCSLCGVVAALIAGSINAPSTARAAGAALLSDGAPTAGSAYEPMVVPGFMYVGVSSCSGEGCHSDEKPTLQSGQMIGDEYGIWFAHDPHRRAFDPALFEGDSPAIAEKLNIEDASYSPRCLSCHTTLVPEPQRGERFDVEQGVGCETCHGPGEKYLEPHATEGWTIEQRGKIGSAGLLKEHGLIDTTDLARRASMCVSCHLQIDKDLLDAGHPSLQFEMYSYNYYYLYNGTQDRIHWDDSKIEWISAKLWAIGQAASLKAARTQAEHWKSKGWDTAQADALIEMYAAGVEIARKHFGADTPEALAQAAYTADACRAAATDLAQRAAGASNQVQRKNIAFGVTALGEAYFNGKAITAPDAFWTAYETASKGEGGQVWESAVKDMADLLK